MGSAAALQYDTADELREALEEAIPGSAVVEIAEFESDFISGSLAYQLPRDKVPDDDSSPRFRVVQFQSEPGDFLR